MRNYSQLKPSHRAALTPFNYGSNIAFAVIDCPDFTSRRRSAISPASSLFVIVFLLFLPRIVPFAEFCCSRHHYPTIFLSRGPSSVVGIRWRRIASRNDKAVSVGADFVRRSTPSPRSNKTSPIGRDGISHAFRSDFTSFTDSIHTTGSPHTTAVPSRSSLVRMTETEWSALPNQRYIYCSDKYLKASSCSEGVEGPRREEGLEDGGVKEDRLKAELALEYERKMKAAAARSRAGTVPEPEDLPVIYVDEHIVVVNKPSGVLCVPGVRLQPSIADVVHQIYRCESGDLAKMIVHRLDMDTSGVVVFARTNASLRTLHDAFRDRHVRKKYEALVCGRVLATEGEINLPLQRDHRHPPFVRVSTPQSEKEAAKAVEGLVHAGYKKIMKKKPKPSLSTYEVIQRETYGEEETTRLDLVPVTGRTHQLRVHCAAMGHPIVGDPVYGYMGEGAPNGGFEDNVMNEAAPGRATLEQQQSIDRVVKENRKALCLHAKYLALKHPFTGAPMVFEAAAPF